MDDSGFKELINLATLLHDFTNPIFRFYPAKYEQLAYLRYPLDISWSESKVSLCLTDMCSRFYI